MSIEALLARYGLPALFLGAGFEGETVVVAGGVLAHKGLVPLPGAMAAAAAGSFAADQLFFFLGRHFRDRPLLRRLTANPAFARAIGWLERWPVGFIFAFRFIYGFRTVSPFAIGASRVSERLFLVVNAVAAAVWGAAFTALGYLAGREVERVMGRYRPSGRTVAIVLGAAITLLLAAHAVRWLWRRRGGRPTG